MSNAAGTYFERSSLLQMDTGTSCTWSRRSYLVFVPRRAVKFVVLNHPLKPKQVVATSKLYSRRKEGETLSVREGDDLEMLCESAQLDRATKVLSRMDRAGIVPSVDMYRSLLKTAAKSKSLAQVKNVYRHLAQHGSECSTSLGELLVITFAQCGGFDDAVEVFNQLTRRTAVSWAALTAGCILSGNSHEVLTMFELLEQEGVKLNRYNFASLLKAVTVAGDLHVGKYLHAEIVKQGYAADVIVATCLIDMYGKCGSLKDAQRVFHGLSCRDVVSWNAMISVCLQHGKIEETLQLYERMLQEGLSPNDRTFVSVLQACGILAETEGSLVADDPTTKLRLLEKGRAIHADAQRKSFDRDVFVGSTLVSMYGKCGSIEHAQNAFDRLSHRDTVTWNALLGAYVRQGQGEKTLQLFNQMMEEGIVPNHRSFVSTIQACSLLSEKEKHVVVDGRSVKSQSLQKGQAIHVDACRKGYGSDIFVGSSLITMYGKCGSVEEAESVFAGLSKKNVVTWTAMLVAYVEQGETGKAFLLYRQMPDAGVTPDVRTFVSSLQACIVSAEKESGIVVDGRSIKVETLEMASVIHADVKSRGFDSDVVVGSTLISLYSKCGSLAQAQSVFERILQRNVVAWTTIITAYVEQGEAEKAIELYEEMLGVGVTPNARTFVSILQAYALLANKDLDILGAAGGTMLQLLGVGKVIHADARRQGYDQNVFVCNTLMSMYGKCGSMKDVLCLFDGLIYPDIVSWNVMVAAHVEQGQGDRAWHLYELMQSEGVSPDVRTLVSALHACKLLAESEEEVLVHGLLTKADSLWKAKFIHAYAKKGGYDSDTYVGSTLVSLYGKCGGMRDAQNMFEGLSKQEEVVVWSAMLSVYVEHGHGEKALQLYRQLRIKGISPDVHAVVSALQACGMMAEQDSDVVMGGQPATLGCLEMGLAVHRDAKMTGYDKVGVVGKTLVSMYGKCGSTVDARNVFDGLCEQDVVSWNAMLGAYVEQGQGKEALHLYQQMKEKGVSSDEVTLICILQACSKTGGLLVLREFHRTLVPPLRDLSPYVASSLISAYGRCASMEEAQRVFEALPQPDAVSWNALLTAYARQGNYVATLQHYKQMQLAGVRPDGVTYVALIAACSHGGLLGEGMEYFESMTRKHGLTPEIEHYASMVDLLGRAGYFDLVEEVLLAMPVQPNLGLWLCLLGACRMYGEVAVAQHAFHQAVRLQPNHSAAYVMMWNVCADAGLWDLAAVVNQRRRLAGASRKSSKSWMEHNHEVQSFSVGAYKCAGHHQELFGLVERLSSELEKRVW